MKKLLFLFMLPALGFSQTFEEIITMTDVERFRKIMIENDYKRHSADSLEIGYAYGLEKDSLGNYVANRWGSYHLKSNSWRLQFLDGFFGNNDYNDIYREVKENCEFSKIIEFNDSTEAVAYNCHDTKLQGVLALRRDEDRSIIWHLNFEINN
jgi:hypothetical protein